MKISFFAVAGLAAAMVINTPSISAASGQPQTPSARQAADEISAAKSGVLSLPNLNMSMQSPVRSLTLSSTLSGAIT